MDSPASRALRLLALLQSGRSWTAQELAERLQVAPRTVRRDIARLRSLGYEVRSSPGPGGVYRLVPSVKIPPLLLDADEICTLVTALLVIEAGAQDDTAMNVRVKLDQLLPPSLRRRAAATAMSAHVITPASHHFQWPLLGTLAEAIADGQHLRFTYTDQHGERTERQVQPYRHVLRKGCWYLIAHDNRRGAWRLFRLDRIQDVRPTSTPAGHEHHAFPHESIGRWLATDFGRHHDEND